MLQPDELKRRLDAIRTLRGLRQIDLAALVEADGHGKHDVGRLERGDVRLTPSLRRSLAYNLRVPEEWFTEPDMDRVLASAVPAQPEQLDRIERMLQDSRRLLLALAANAGVIELSGGEQAQIDVRKWMADRGFQDPAEAPPATSEQRRSTGS